jgi:hypothetical protein
MSFSIIGPNYPYITQQWLLRRHCWMEGAHCIDYFQGPCNIRGRVLNMTVFVSTYLI